MSGLRFSSSLLWLVCVRSMHCDRSLLSCSNSHADLDGLNEQEILVGKRLPVHPNLPIFVGYSLSPGPRVVWERIGGPDIESFFRSQREGDDGWRPKEKHALSWSRQLFSALACLHSDGLMHRDVKPSNILIKSDQKTITLIDFGICRSVSAAAGDKRPLSGQTGSFRYMAPEVAADQDVYEYASKVDVYSGAMCTWFMHAGERPFSNLPGHQVAELAHRVALRPSAASVKNDRLASLLSQAWDVNPAARPTAHEMEARLEEIQESGVTSVRGIFKGMGDRLKEGMSHLHGSFIRTKSLDGVASWESGTVLRNASPAGSGSGSDATMRTPEPPQITLSYPQLKEHRASHGASCSPPLCEPGTPESLEGFWRRASSERCSTAPTLRRSSMSMEFSGSEHLSQSSNTPPSLSSSADFDDAGKPQDGKGKAARPSAEFPRCCNGAGGGARGLMPVPPSLTAHSRSEHDAADSGVLLQKPVCVWRA